jgi:beta-glucosidase
VKLTRRYVLGLLGSTTILPAIDRFPAAAQKLAGPLAARATYKNGALPIDQRVHDLVQRMTVAEKARQLDMYAALSDRTQRLSEHDAEFLRDNHSHLSVAHDVSEGTEDLKVATGKDAHFDPEIGKRLWGVEGVGAIHGLYPTPELANAIQHWLLNETRLGIPALFVEEGLHGYEDGTIFPSPANLAATWNVSLAQQTGAAIAAEARAHGVGMILAPVLDLARDPRWGRVEEDFGEDPWLSGQLGLAYVRGAQSARLSSSSSVVAEVKHFAGYGSPESGTNTSPVHVGERELRSMLLKSMEPAIREGGAMAVMAAYPEIDGLPITADPHLLIDILRTEWGFRGFVLSDLGAIRHLFDRHFLAATPKDAVVRAINSGVDMQFYDFDHATFQGAIQQGIADGSLAHEALDRAVAGVLRVKFALGLFDEPAIDPALAAEATRSASHLQLSLECARQSMTLLRNEGNLLPLPKTLQKIALIGPNGDQALYGDYADEKKGAHISLLQGIRDVLGTDAVLFSDGKDRDAAVALAKQASVTVLALGEQQGVSGEGFDRSDLGLPGDQQALLEAVSATGTRVVLVLQNGRPLTINWAAKHVPAILEAWYPGEFGGTAIAETLFGDHNPAGRLAITFPQSVGQLPDFYNYDPSKKTKYTDSDGLPLFPFGFGLSYTTFAYTNLRVTSPSPGTTDDVVIKVDVNNTGGRLGDEVAQLYFRQAIASVETPIRSLAGFERISLRPGEMKTVTFRLRQQHLKLWNEQRMWIIEPGDFLVWIGGSSTATLTAQFRIYPGTRPQH